jgi:hypothetical protein
MFPLFLFPFSLSVPVHTNERAIGWFHLSFEMGVFFALLWDIARHGLGTRRQDAMRLISLGNRRSMTILEMEKQGHF